MSEILQELIQTESEKSDLSQKAKIMLNDMKHDDSVCKLNKSLYGLKQAGRQWNLKLNSKLLRMGLKATCADPCIYFAWKNNTIMLLSVYVDDILISSKDVKWINDIKCQLREDFDIKDLGKANYCLGIEIDQNSKGVTICQQGYIRDIIKNFNMVDAKPLSLPLQMGNKLTIEEIRTTRNQPYKELIGALMYASVATRPDIAHAVSVLAQFSNNHTENHWNAAKRVLKYLIGSINFGLHYLRNEKGVQGFVDSDWGGCPIDRRSYTGYVFTLSGAAINWKSQKQRTVALSSTEAEYMGITEGIKEALHISSFMHEIRLPELSKVMVYNDNRGAKLLAENQVFHQRTKHIDIRYHFIRAVLARGRDIYLEYLPTEEMIADVLTKALPGPKHHHCLKQMGLFEM